MSERKNADLQNEELEPGVAHCPICRTPEGQFHEWGCTLELCPFCAMPFRDCQCHTRLVDMEDEDRREAYIRLLKAVGRVRYVATFLRCGNCGECPPEEYWVPDRVWRFYVPVDLREKVLCLECFRFIKGRVDKFLTSAEQPPITDTDLERFMEAYRTRDSDESLEVLQELEPERPWAEILERMNSGQ